MLLTTEPWRWGGAALLSGAWLALTLAIGLARRKRRAPADAAPNDWLVVYASQTGSAEDLAVRSAELLAAGGVTARTLNIAQLGEAQLQGAGRILFVASTYGEGDAPDDAAGFASRAMGTRLDDGALARLHYAVLALGDRNYDRFCGFGRDLDGWLAAHGAQHLFERIEVDRGDPAALAEWRRHLARLAGTSDAPDWSGPPFGDWRIAARTLLNPGSAGAPLYRLALVPAAGALPSWEAGDLAQVAPPGDPAHPREYSIASLPADGCLELLVRLERRADGTPGLASSWLCEGARADAAVRLRVRAHERFRLGGNAERRLILVGNGSGLAGLRSLLKARIAQGMHDNWLVFGERNAAHDFLLREELDGWQADGSLARLDLAFSRDGARDGGAAAKRYVQDLLRERALEVAEWVRHGAAIYVCGSLQGMAGGVHGALEDILGAAVLDALAADGRYRRDVY